jgi:branched-subunit amino acid transport protein AzlD
MLIENKGNEPSKENYKKVTLLKKSILINSIVSLLIFLFFTVMAVTDKDNTAFIVAAICIPIQWAIYYLAKWSICYLKRKSPADWRAVLSVWIACAAFLMLSMFCWKGTENEDMSTGFIIGSLSIAAVLATVLFSIKKMKNES